MGLQQVETERKHGAYSLEHIFIERGWFWLANWIPCWSASNLLEDLDCKVLVGQETLQEVLSRMKCG